MTTLDRAWRVRLCPDNSAWLPADRWYLVGDRVGIARWRVFDLETYRPLGPVGSGEISEARPPEHRRTPR